MNNRAPILGGCINRFLPVRDWHRTLDSCSSYFRDTLDEFVARTACPAGPIPASAGEPGEQGHLVRDEGAYPRQRGGIMAVAAKAGRRAGKGVVALRAAVAANADRFAEGLAPVLQDIRAAGHVSLRAMAAELNRRGMRTKRGGIWQVSNLRNLVGRSNTSQGPAADHVQKLGHEIMGIRRDQRTTRAFDNFQS